MAVKERVRAGGRSARIQSAVHEAVRHLSAKTSRDELTVPQIAAEAGVTPSTIYRRWGDLAALLADVAVERLRPISDPEDTGAVASDLRAFIEQFMEEMSSTVGRTLLREVFSPSAPDLFGPVRLLYPANTWRPSLRGRKRAAKRRLISMK